MQKSKKIVLLGHFGVGKTSLIRRFVENHFSDAYKVTIGVHISKKTLTLPSGNEIKLIIWDLEGTDEVQLIRQSYLLGTHGAIFVFDVSRPSTFQHLKEDLAIVGQKMPRTPLLVVGNKADLVNREDLDTMLQKHGISTKYLTSAKTGEAVEEMFALLTKQITTDANQS